jgi:deazaflavin-dependent oxidoreductase (nitroreductase family)
VEPIDYSARAPYRPPPGWYRRFQWLGVLLTSAGLAPRDAVTLEVRGRGSGKVRRTPVVRVRDGGESFLVSLAGESQWVRNVRAAGGRAVIRRRRATRVRLIEVPPGQRPPIIAAYLARSGRSQTRAAAREARQYFGLGAHPTQEDIAAIAGYYPTYRIAADATTDSGPN